MSARVLLIAAVAMSGVAACAPAAPTAGPALGCYDSTDIWDVRVTAPLGGVRNAEMLYGSFGGRCDGDITFVDVGTLAKGTDGPEACNEAASPGNWVEEIDLSTFTSPASLAGYWLCLPLRA